MEEDQGHTRVVQTSVFDYINGSIVTILSNASSVATCTYSQFAILNSVFVFVVMK